MDGFIILKQLMLFLMYVILSNQKILNKTKPFECPLVDAPTTVNDVIVHNITRSLSCMNGWYLSGCCVERMYCNFSTQNIDLSLYGPPGFRTICDTKQICCPQNYTLPIPISNSTKEDSSSSSMDSGDNSVSSFSDSIEDDD